MERKEMLIIELTVNNHPGVMTQITALFSRRAFNLEGILCTPCDDDRSRSRMFLLVAPDGRLEQIIRQLEKLYDVLDVSVREDVDHRVFRRLYGFLQDGAAAAAVAAGI